MSARRLVWAGACLGALMGLAAGNALAQDTLNMRSVSNSYIEVLYGISGSVSIDQGNYKGSRPIAGCFGIRTTGGDPTTAQDDDTPIMDEFWGFHAPMFSRLTVRVENADGTWKDLMCGSTENGGVWREPPYADDKKGKITAIWESPNDGVAVDIDLSLVRDNVRFGFAIRNTGTETRKIGARLFFGLDNAPDLGNFVPYFVSGTGRVSKAREWSGPEVPSFWRTFDAVDYAPWLTIRGILRGMDATPPDRFAITRLDSASDWEIDTGSYELVDTQTLHTTCLWWNPEPLAPGGTATRKIATYYGLGTATEDQNYPYVLSVQAPFTVDYLQDDETGTGVHDPDTITVRASVMNRSALDFSSANLWINLPDGMTLADGEMSTKSVTDIPQGAEGTVSWKVKIAPEASGLLKFSVGASTNPVALSKTVVREIGIMAGNMHRYQQGWQMFSVPFDFQNGDPKTALGLASGSFDLWEWDATANQYVPVSNLVAGKGYWLRSAIDMMGTIPIQGGSATPVIPGSRQQVIELKAGWNQFASPFISPYAWRSVKVLQNVSDPNQPLSLKDALDRGWVRRTLYWWDPVNGPLTGQYSWTSDMDSMRLVPWVSYWVKANTPCRLILDPPVTGDWYGMEAP